MAPDTPPLILGLRALCGWWFLPHIIAKLRNRHLASQTFERVGLRPGLLALYATVATEILAALGLIFNLYVRWAALLAILVLLGASVAVIRLNGPNWRWQKQGPEYMLFWSIACALSAWPW